MGTQGYLILLSLLVFVNSVTSSSSRAATWCPSTDSLNRSSFPEGFIFGAGSSAYQYEGTESKDGRGPSIWDTFSKIPGKIEDGTNGDVADDSYHRYKEDVKIIKGMGLDAYRFSISWSRVLPHGKQCWGVNRKGVEYYNNLINELIANDIEPFVTLFHFDLPQDLEKKYGGFLSPAIVNDFRDYANFCFKNFGDRVKYWTTLNEPSIYSKMGYALGAFAPGRCSIWQGNNCTGGDSSKEPYWATHYLLLAHANAVQLYKEKYQTHQRGKIGITLLSNWIIPYSKAREDWEATLRAIDFSIGWFMDPLTMGDYPLSMRNLVGNRLPNFSKQESKLLNGSFDFLGLNYYTTKYAIARAPFSEKPSYLTDSQASLTVERNEVPIGPTGALDWLCSYPRGLQDLLLYIKATYKINVPIYITENGIAEANNSTLTLLDALTDSMRIEYHQNHLYFLQQAIEAGVNVKGYFIWSLLDNFEWNLGYTTRFGLYYVDYEQSWLTRYPKLSAFWFKNFLRRDFSPKIENFVQDFLTNDSKITPLYNLY